MANSGNKTTLVVAFWHKGPDGKDYAPGDTYTTDDPTWVTTKINDGHVQVKGDAPTPA